jgi:hypothetical protein
MGDIHVIFVSHCYQQKMHEQKKKKKKKKKKDEKRVYNVGQTVKG